MQSFDYLSVLLSIIVGLAITQVLLGFRRLILTRIKVKLYLTTVIWAGLALLMAIQAWWANFGLRTLGNWTFLAFIVIVLQAISVYMATAVVLPDITGDFTVDLRDHYFAHRSWFFGFMLASAVLSAAKEFALNGHLPGGLNGVFHVIFVLAATVAAITRREWVHKLLTLAFALLFLLYISLLFARLELASIVANEVSRGLSWRRRLNHDPRRFCLHSLAAEIQFQTFTQIRFRLSFVKLE